MEEGTVAEVLLFLQGEFQEKLNKLESESENVKSGLR